MAVFQGADIVKRLRYETWSPCGLVSKSVSQAVSQLISELVSQSLSQSVSQKVSQ